MLREGSRNGVSSAKWRDATPCSTTEPEKGIVAEGGVIMGLGFRIRDSKSPPQCSTRKRDDALELSSGLVASFGKCLSPSRIEAWHEKLEVKGLVIGVLAYIAFADLSEHVPLVFLPMRLQLLEVYRVFTLQAKA